MKVRRIPKTIDRWQDEHSADNFSEAVRHIIDVVQPRLDRVGDNHDGDQVRPNHPGKYG